MVAGFGYMINTTVINHNVNGYQLIRYFNKNDFLKKKKKSGSRICSPLVTV